jgi:hypothetical protein
MPPHCKPHHDSQVTGQLKDVPSQIEAVPLLVRRCIEALMVKQMVEAFSEEFDPKRVVDLAARAIRRSAFKAGEELAATTNDRSLEAFSCILGYVACRRSAGDRYYRTDCNHALLQRNSVLFCRRVQETRNAGTGTHPVVYPGLRTGPGIQSLISDLREHRPLWTAVRFVTSGSGFSVPDA